MDEQVDVLAEVVQLELGEAMAQPRLEDVLLGVGEVDARALVDDLAQVGELTVGHRDFAPPAAEGAPAPKRRCRGCCQSRLLRCCWSW